jgi:hypothetical protein
VRAPEVPAGLAVTVFRIRHGGSPR